MIPQTFTVTCEIRYFVNRARAIVAIIRPVFVCLNSTYRRACRYRGVCWRACSTKYSGSTTTRRSFPTRPRKKRFESPPPGTCYRPRFVYSPTIIPTCLNTSGGSVRDGGDCSPKNQEGDRPTHFQEKGPVKYC